MTTSTRGTTSANTLNQASTSINVRLQPDRLVEVDTWAAAQDDKPSQPEGDPPAGRVGGSSGRY